MERVDAHQHLWRYTPEEYGWLDEPALLGLRRDFLLPELRAAMQEARVEGTIAVQARQTVEETRWLLDLARASVEEDGRAMIRGVVGWAPLREPAVRAVLDELRTDEGLKGLRHVVQTEPEGFLEGEEFNRGVAAIEGTGLVYDVLILERQIGEATRFVDRHPRQSFVLDHGGKPRIAAGEREPWASGIRELARREGVSCKLSGLVTEAAGSKWTAETLAPYLDVLVEAFGMERLMAGSDWPVCLPESGYGAWWRLLEDYFASFSEGERAAVFGGVAKRVYRL